MDKFVRRIDGLREVFRFEQRVEEMISRDGLLYVKSGGRVYVLDAEGNTRLTSYPPERAQ
jgi:hypothetical protein